MPRKARDERLETRTARLKLKPRREPYWRTIQEGRALGYRRLAGGKAGTWIARAYDPASGRRYRSLGSADDMLEADGIATLTFPRAQDAARAWFEDLARARSQGPEPVTVADAIESYLAEYTARGGKARRYVETTFKAHVLPTFRDTELSDLTAEAIRKWHNALAASPARLRTSPKDDKQKVRTIENDDEDGKRARRATANAILTLFKAALNFAYREGRAASDDAWRRVRPFQKVQAARVRYLTDDEATRLVNACPSDLRLLVVAALLTGCRYQELARLERGDIDLSAGTLAVRMSKSGAARHVVLTDEAKRFFEGRMVGKATRARLLVRTGGEPWGKSQQFRPLRKACSAANIVPAVSFHILRHTHASRLAMKGVPMAVIAAQLGHSDVKITVKHYAHLSPGYVADTIRAAFGSLGIVPEGNVATLHHGSGG